MDCIKSFNILLIDQVVESSPETYFWTAGSQHFWLYDSTNPVSTLTVQGFKNINIYKIEINGDVFSSAGAPSGFAAIVNNWHIGFSIDGQNSNFVGGVVVAGGFNMLQQPNNADFALSKYQRSISFATPIQSASKLTVYNLYADGIANQSNVSLHINWTINMTIFYTFEGEDLAFL